MLEHARLEPRRAAEIHDRAVVAGAIARVDERQPFFAQVLERHQLAAGQAVPPATATTTGSSQTRSIATPGVGAAQKPMATSSSLAASAAANRPDESCRALIRTPGWCSE
jgi:hypothetical protein